MNDIALNMCVHGFVWMFFIPLSTYLGGTVPLFGYRLLILVGIWFACCSLRWLLFYGLKESKDLFISFLCREGEEKGEVGTIKSFVTQTCLMNLF